MAVFEKGFAPVVKQGFVNAAICFNILGHGCVVGFLGILLPQLDQPDSLIPLDNVAKSWLASIMVIPIIIGNFTMPSLMGRFGRRVATICVIVMAIVGWLLIAISENLWMLLLARIVCGISFGMNMPLRSVFIGEYTSPKYRGSFLIFVSLSQGFGVFLVHTLGSFVFWQKTALICISFHFISLLLMLYAPESPSFLAMTGRTEECKEVFRWLRGDGEEKELVMLIIKAQSYTEKKSVSFWTTLKKKEFYKPVTIMIHASALSQFSGGTSFAVYSTTVTTLIFGTAESAHFWMIFLDAQRIISNALAIFVIRRVKRRTMLFSISILCIASHIAIAVYVFARNRGLFEYDSLWIPILLVNIQMFTVATAMLPLPHVIAGEIFPYEYRGLGGSISILSLAASSFFVLKTFPRFSTTIGIEGIYTIYSVAMIYFTTVIWFMLPETKDKTLQEIEEEFKGKPKILEDGLEPLQKRNVMANVSGSPQTLATEKA